MSALRKCIADIKASSLQYQPFIDRIKAWIEKFEFDEIVEFRKKHAGEKE